VVVDAEVDAAEVKFLAPILLIYLSGVYPRLLTYSQGLFSLPFD
jgi:hypothetical protein